MSNDPKFADHTKLRGFFKTPLFKYAFGAGLALTGIVYVSSYCTYSLVLGEKLEKFRSKYIYVGPTNDPALTMVLEKLLLLKQMAKEEEKAEKK